MKTIIIALTLLFTASVTATYASDTTNTPVEVLDTAQKNLFKFKVSNDLVGATVQLIHVSGDVVTTEVLNKKKMIIDFCDVKPGTYHVLIENGKTKEKIDLVLEHKEGVKQVNKR